MVSDWPPWRVELIAVTPRRCGVQNATSDPRSQSQDSERATVFLRRSLGGIVRVPLQLSWRDWRVLVNASSRGWPKKDNQARSGRCTRRVYRE